MWSDRNSLARIRHISAADERIAVSVWCSLNDEFPAWTGGNLLGWVTAIGSDIVDEAVVKAVTPIALRCRSGRRTVFRTRAAVSGVDISSNVRHEVLFNEVLGFSAILNGNTGTGKLAAAEDNILLYETDSDFHVLPSAISSYRLSRCRQT